MIAGAPVLKFGEDFRMSFRLYQALPGVGALAAALAGCTGNSAAPASIDYHQIGFCNTYATPGGERAAKPDEVFIVYKIDAVDNTKRNADFTFLPTRLYVDRAIVKEGAGAGTNKAPLAAKPETNRMGWVAQTGETPEWIAKLGSRRFIPNDTSFAQAMGVRAASATVVPASVKTAINGYSMVAVVNPDEGRPAEQIFFSLNYDRQEGEDLIESVPADPPVILNNTTAAQTSWPHPANCRDLALDKLAS